MIKKIYNWFKGLFSKEPEEFGYYDQSTLELVRDWHIKFGVPNSREINIDDYELNSLRVDLIQEELDELKEALYVKDEVAVADALSDIQYVLDGTYLSLGFAKHKKELFNEVHKSNMSKLDDNGKPIYRDDGKVLKSNNFKEPKLRKIIL